MRGEDFLEADSGDGSDDLEGNEEPVFDSVVDFVTTYLSPILCRRLNRSVALWCPSWWKHPEALTRLAVMWRAFEFLRHDEMLGLSTWWLEHADPHLRVLMDPELGPFVACDPIEGHSSFPLGPLPLDLAPPEIADHPALGIKRRATSED